MKQAAVKEDQSILGGVRGNKFCEQLKHSGKSKKIFPQKESKRLGDQKKRVFETGRRNKNWKEGLFGEKQLLGRITREVSD